MTQRLLSYHEEKEFSYKIVGKGKLHRRGIKDNKFSYQNVTAFSSKFNFTDKFGLKYCVVMTKVQRSVGVFYR